MWWIILSIVIGTALIIMSLCKTASISDRDAENIYQATHRGDNDGDN